MALVIDDLPAYPMALRKDILLLTRVRTPPENNPRLIDQLVTWEWPSIDFVPGKTSKSDPNFVGTPKKILNLVGTIVYSAVLTSLLSSYLRTITFDSPLWEELEENEFLKSAFKEFQATQQEDTEPLLNYNAILNPLCFGQRFHPKIEPNIPLAKYIHRQLVQWRTRLTEKILYPRYSSKSMSRETAGTIGLDRCTGVDVENFYHRTGRIAGGSIEMRQAWKGNDLTPRTYFAQGGDAYNASKYCQDIFNELVDSLSSTHRFGRFDLSKFKLTPDHVSILYDFSSFTSSMFEQKWFLRALANFCIGHRVHLFDTHYGPVETDLGLLLLDYIQNTTDCSRFYLRGDLVEKTGLFGYFVHRVAGFLGVYGNLASCTFLHGVIALYITGKEDFTSVVGDDALIAKILKWARTMDPGEIDDDANTIEGVIAVLQSVGNIARQKFAILESPLSDYDDEILDRNTWAYLKRSLTRFSDSVHLDIQYDIANLALVFDYNDTLRDYGHSEPIKAVASQITALLIKIFRNNASDESLEQVAIILRGIYREFGFPHGGLVPGEKFLRRHVVHKRLYGRTSGDILRSEVEAFFIVPVLPFYPEDFRHDPLRVLAESKVDQMYKLPQLQLSDETPVVDFSRLMIGDVAVGKSKVSKYLVDFGYVEKENIYQEQSFPYDPAEVFECFNRLRDRRYRLCTQYRVIARIPDVFL